MRKRAHTESEMVEAGIVNVCYCLEQTELPLKGNYDPKHYLTIPF